MYYTTVLAPPQLVKYDVHTTRKIKFIHAIFYHTLLLYACMYHICFNGQSVYHLQKTVGSTFHILDDCDREDNCQYARDCSTQFFTFVTFINAFLAQA